jgi:hypothetical protein
VGKQAGRTASDWDNDLSHRYVTSRDLCDTRPATIRWSVVVASALVRLTCGARCCTANPQSHSREAIQGLPVQDHRRSGGSRPQASWRFALDNGRDRNFDTYDIPRFSWVPRIDIVLVKNDGLAPQGGGEPPITTTGAVIANAVFDATGARMLRLPMTAARVHQTIAMRSAS